MGVIMGLSKFRKNAGKGLMPITRAVAGTGISPNALTWLSLVFAILAGISIYFMADWVYSFLLALLFGSLSSVLDLLDGDIARLTGKSTTMGDFLDHTIDRYADLAMILGIVFSPLCSIHWGLIAVTGMLLVSYMGTQAEALNIDRIYGGLLGRADRLTILGVAALSQFILLLVEPNWTLPYVLKFGSIQIDIVANGKFFGIHLFTWAMIYFSFAGHYTALFRAGKIQKILKEREMGKKEKEPMENRQKEKDGKEKDGEGEEEQ